MEGQSCSQLVSGVSLGGIGIKPQAWVTEQEKILEFRKGREKALPQS